MENRNPLRVYCKNCGAPAGFDIVRQTYACASCGALTGIQETKEAVFRWRTLQKQSHAVNPAGLTLEEYSCPACGAQIVFERGEASETCDFCGSKLIRKELTEAERMPELIIPFFITPEEARKRMLGWAHEHEDTPEGRSIVSSMGRFQGYYLPYYLIRGPVYGMVTRDGNNRTYRCAGYLEGTVVNLSQQMDNLTLDGITPFDWSTVHPFEYGYIAGHHVKLSDISDTETDRRIREKTAEDFLSEVEKVMQSSGVCVQVETGNISVASALLPVYFIKSGKLTVVMNGQTGSSVLYLCGADGSRNCSTPRKVWLQLQPWHLRNKGISKPRQLLLPIVSGPPRQLPAQAIHRLAFHLLCPALAEVEMECRIDQRVLDSIGKPIAVQQIGLLSGSQLVQRRIQFCQLFFLDIDLLRRLSVRVGYGFDPQHPFII